MIAPIISKIIANNGRYSKNTSSTPTLAGFASAYAIGNKVSKNGVNNQIAPPIINITIKRRIMVIPPLMIKSPPREHTADLQRTAVHTL